MHRSTPIKAAAALGAATLLAVAAPLTANAHVTVNPSNTAASSYSVLTFSVGHGCEGSSTTALTFTVPQAISSVTPTVNPGWTIESDENTVVYTAGEPLVDGMRTTFELSVRLPELPAGEKLEFPVLQECEAGSIDWAESTVEAGEEPAHPAPFIVLTEATADGHTHPPASDHDADEAASGESAGEQAAAADNSDDVVARVLGIAGLVVGTVGVMIGVTSRRKEVSK